jgi:diguanylate cyclase (GGDEF)-like protein
VGKLISFTRSALGRKTTPPFRSLTVASVLTFLGTICLATSVVLWSATKSDQLTRARQRQVVVYALQQNIDKIPYDQESVANWDDSVTNVKITFDADWVNTYLGVWMYDYFKHDRLYVLNGDRDVLYAMADGKSTTNLAAGSEILSAVAALKSKIYEGALDAYESGHARLPRHVDVAFSEGRPAIISVMPLVSHTGKIVQPRGSEPIIASVRFLDTSFLPDLANAYLLSGVRFSRLPSKAALEDQVPVQKQSGTVLGYLVWKPDLAGATILADVLPILFLGLVTIGSVISLLIAGLRKACGQIVTNELRSKHLAYHDSLTNLPNRSFFNDHLEQGLLDVKAGGKELALLLLDLDRFKQVNDTFGHAAGDALIKEIAKRLRAALPVDSVLARIGGDEFAVVLRGSLPHQDIEALSQDIVLNVSKPINALGNWAVVGVSIGVAVAPGAGTDRDELTRKADVALYQAKRSSHRSYEFFSEDISESIKSRQVLELELRDALQHKRDLEVVYQPIVCAKSGKLAGVEALSRWHHPILQTVPPLKFISLAEECGLIDELGDWVLRESILTARTLDLAKISVNVSPMQAHTPGFAERVLRILKEGDMEPSRLEIEITENVLLDATGFSLDALKTLRAAGVTLALDDFGTGYSSLSYLLRLEVDRIKIDRSFVHSLGDTSQSGAIVEAIVRMAQAVNLSVTAEGVETVSQKEFLIEIGCNNLQGYLFSPPVSALTLTTMVDGREQEDTSLIKRAASA